MADAFVALIALVLGIIFLANAAGALSGLVQLKTFANMQSFYGRFGLRLIFLVLGLVLLAASAAIWWDWRVFS